MKRYIKSAVDNNQTIIRMVLNNSSKQRSPFYSNTMIKLRFDNLQDDATAVILAVAFSVLDNYEDIVKYGPNLSEADLNYLKEVAAEYGVVDKESAKSYLYDQDPGSGEAIVFSVRFGGKIVYSSGLKESSFGRMPKYEDNTEDRMSTEDEISAAFDSLRRYANSRGLAYTDVMHYDSSGPYDYSHEYMIIYKIADVINSDKKVALVYSYASFYPDLYGSTRNTRSDYNSAVSACNRSKRYYSGLQLSLESPHDVEGESVFLLRTPFDGMDCDYMITDSVPYKSNVKKALQRNDDFVAVPSR